MTNLIKKKVQGVDLALQTTTNFLFLSCPPLSFL